MNGAEAKDDVASRGGATKTKHGTETREEEHLVQLVAQVLAVGASEDLIAGHGASGVHGDIHHESVGQGKFHVAKIGGPGLRVGGEFEQFGRGASS